MRLLRQSLRYLLPACLVLYPLSGCQSTPVPTAMAARRAGSVVAGNRTLLIEPRFDTYHTQSAVAPYTKTSINHLVLKLYVVTGSGEAEALDADSQPIQLDVPNAKLDSTVSFTNLKPSTTYRVKALAYQAAGTNAGDLISTQDANSYVDVLVADDNRPTMQQLKVQLLSRDVSMRLAGANTLVDRSADKNFPRVAYNATDDEYLVVWQDNRGGDYDIYGRRVGADGVPKGGEFTIYAGAGHQTKPVVAYSDSSHAYLVVWEDQRVGYGDIYARRVLANGTPAGTSAFAVTTQSLQDASPSVAYNDHDHEFMVAWHYDPVNQADILGQRVGTNDALNGGLLTFVHDGSAQFCPSLAYNPTLNQYLLTWQDNKNASYDIYGKILNPDGSEAVAEFPVSRISGSDQTAPSAAYSPSRQQYFVAWHDRRNAGGYDIYGQHLDAVGAPLGTTETANLALCTATGDQTNPLTAYDAIADQFFVAWMDARGTGSAVYARRVGQPTDVPPAEQAITSGAYNEAYPGLAYGGANGFLVAWQDGRYNNIYTGRVTPSNDVSAVTELTSSLASACIQEHPRVAYNPVKNEYLAVWTDWRAGSADANIYARRVGADGVAIGRDFVVCNAANNQDSPAVVYNSQDDLYMVIWRDQRNTRPHTFIRQVGPNGSLIGSERIAAVGTFTSQNEPSLAYNSRDNNYMVAWHEAAGTGADEIYAQPFTKDGPMLSANLRVTTRTGVDSHPAIAYNSQANEFLVTMQNDTDGAVYGQRIAANGTLAGSAILASSHAGAEDNALAYDDQANRYLAVWTSLGQLRGQLIGADGTLTGFTSPDVNFVISSAGHASPGMSVAYNAAAKEYLVAWTDNRAGNNDIYAQRVDADGTPVGSSATANFLVSAAGLAQQDPAIAYNSRSNEWFATWRDLRNSASDIYGQRIDSYCVN